MGSAYTISVRGTVYGPVPEEQLKEDIAKGWLRPDAFFWDPRQCQWLPILQVKQLYEVFFGYHELELAGFKDPVNSSRRVYLTNRRLVVTPSSGRLDAAVDSARRWLGSKLPDEVVQVPLDSITRITLMTNSLPLTETVEVGLEYVDQREHHTSLSLLLYPSDRGPFLSALERTRKHLVIIDKTPTEEQLRMARGGKVEIKNIQGDLVREKVESKYIDSTTTITDSIISRSQVGPQETAAAGATSGEKAASSTPTADAPAKPHPPPCHHCGHPQEPVWLRCPFCLK